MSELWDAPNQQAVGLDPPWVEGTGGSSEGEVTPSTDSMTKAQLLEQAKAQGVEADESMTKAEIQAALEAG